MHAWSRCSHYPQPDAGRLDTVGDLVSECAPCVQGQGLVVAAPDDGAAAGYRRGGPLPHVASHVEEPVRARTVRIPADGRGTARPQIAKVRVPAGRLGLTPRVPALPATGH